MLLCVTFEQRVAGQGVNCPRTGGMAGGAVFESCLDVGSTYESENV